MELEWEHFELAGSSGWLPVIGMERYYKATLGTTAGSQSVSVLGITREGSPYIAYDSLANMLKYHADVYESGALRTDDQGRKFFDYTITSALTRKHFPDKATEAEEEYRSKCSLPAHRTAGTPDRPSPEELAQFALVSKLAQAGSLQAVPATEQYLEWLLGDVEQAKQVTSDLVKSPCSIMYGWPHERSLLVHNFSYSYTL